MDENAWVSHWQNVLEDVFWQGSPEEKKRVKPNENHLNQLEDKLCISLPYSYRAFVRVFGPGRLALSVDVFAPGYRGSNVIDFLGNNKWQTDTEQENQIKSPIAFAILNYQYFVWDTSHLTMQDEHEYAIFYMPASQDQSPIQVCSTFSSFVEDYCLTGQYWTLFGAEPKTSWEDEETGVTRPIKCFFPIGEKPNSKF